jgi:hypothetical protein
MLRQAQDCKSKWQRVLDASNAQWVSSPVERDTTDPKRHSTHTQREATQRSVVALFTARRAAAALPRLLSLSVMVGSGRAGELLSIDQGVAVAANHSYAALHLVCAGHAATSRASCWRTNLAH